MTAEILSQKYGMKSSGVLSDFLLDDSLKE